MRILFVTDTRLSSVVLSTPLLVRLLQSYPQAAVDMLCAQGSEELFAGLPNLGRILTLSPRHDWRRRLKHVISLRQDVYDIIVDLGDRKPLALLRYRKLLRPHVRQGQHLAQTYANLWPSAKPLEPTLWLTQRVVENARRELKLYGGGPVITLDVSSRNPYKRWPPQYWGALCHQLLQIPAFNRAVFMVVGETHEESQIAALAKVLPRQQFLNLVGVTTVGDVAAYVGQSDLFVGLEGGVMHLAAAQGVPTIGLFGPYCEKTWGPTGRKGRAVVPPRRLWSELNLPGNLKPRVMTDISVQETLSNVVQLWEDRASVP